MTTNSQAGPEPERLLPLAQAGDGAARGHLLELYRGYLALLARLQIGRRRQLGGAPFGHVRKQREVARLIRGADYESRSTSRR